MPLTIAVTRERTPGEHRVALVPETAKKFAALGAQLRMDFKSDDWFKFHEVSRLLIKNSSWPASAGP